MALDRLAERQSPIGQTIPRSGFRTNSSGRKMDWALVEVSSSHRFAKGNVVWHQDREYAEGHRPTELSGLIRGETLQTTAKLDPGDWVCLKGRTSGSTTGIVHKIRLEVNDWTSREGELVSHEIVAIHTGNKNLLLGEGGDSGAWILNASGQLVGQQIAVKSDHDQREHFTVISPIQDVFQDIEALTACTVTQPIER